jgi:HD-GYP domain-containing protein (c-di-GMP phosphodiesterase class II)
VSIISQPEFRVPLNKVLPGMVLSRNLEHNGQLLLRYGVELDDDRIHKLSQLGVSYIHIHFNNEDIVTYKNLLVNQDSPPSYERLLDLTRRMMIDLIPDFARPEHAARSPQVGALVSEVVEHTLDIIFGSKRCFDLLKTTRMFQATPLTHCPAAWIYSLCTGVGLGYNLPTLLDLSLASLFYDIGMLKVPKRILAKPGRLTDMEFGEIKKHVFFSRRMLEGLTDFSASAVMVSFQHHENYYGGGYPKNKRGDGIHEFSQIVSLTDKFAAMVTPKNYREPFQPYQAYEVLLAQTKSAVSPKVFVAFLKSVLLYPRGSMLRLSSGEIAEPIDFPLHVPTRPIVRVTHGPAGEEIMGKRREINLVDHPELHIEAFSIAGQAPQTVGMSQVPRGLLE